MPRNDGRRFYLGVGLSQAAGIDDAAALAGRAMALAEIDAGQIDGVATIDSRRDHAVVVELARQLGAGISAFSPDVLEAETPRLKNPSEMLFARIGCHGVAEAAALAVAGKQAVLIVEKMSSGGVTVAIAIRTTDFLK